MWRNKKMVLIAVMAAILLAAGISGAVYAKAGGTAAGNEVLNQAANVTSSNDTLMARAAKILGIDQQKLQDAIKQARGDMQNEKLDKYLQNLIDQGKITQAQADKFKAWWQSRPTSAQTTIQQYKDWMQARPTDVPLPRGFAGPGACGPVRGAGPVRGGMPMSRGIMGRF
ncbi:MAG: hypothetical protein Q7R50_02850 [Dehalococcoidales bacterium]|nr:hypothetical protein [Dehalococcoidales bacterium]